MNPLTKTAVRLLVAAALAVPLTACNQGAEPEKKAEKAPLTAPADENVDGWRAYVSDVVGRHMDGVNGQPFVYLLPAESDADFQGKYDRLLEKAQGDVSRGILPGSMLAFAMAAPNSAKSADLVIAAFGEVQPEKLKGVKVLYVGKAEDDARVKAAVTPSGADYIFVEAK